MSEQQGIGEMEQTRERASIVLGRLGDLGLGNPDGIPSYYADTSDEELQQIAEKDNEALVEPNDLSCTACIDGRRCRCNSDGSEAKIRLRRVGGSASNLGVALNAEAPVVSSFDPEASIGAYVKAVDGVVGYRSAHLGGCGGANGEILDHQAIHDNETILAVTKTFMNIPEVASYFGVGYDDTLGERVRHNAGVTAALLESKGWNGQRFVEGAKKHNACNVEDLEVDEADEKYHGHHEPKLTIVIGDKTLDDDGFTWNLKASKDAARRLADDDDERYQQALIAEVAKHMAVANRLPSDKTPVFLQIA